eukprot:CAMPEP_0198354648 /NCGR_PEP_ID=MMETSP1450-20131203/116110_1 /TAXON_ID=753684 ORGANISM="Madagascaria erythrocladiodes, Strain CCMP3234" /NCGR_SAMPLE_ID=MMETSP1450 /ASSEMBLY_ACC=CAM_ASM_001115 /LENGTH=44 /DNA_ID= /DNA_START= /DNA_END= /DNA_ORIENTATION=
MEGRGFDAHYVAGKRQELPYILVVAKLIAEGRLHSVGLPSMDAT